MLKPLMISFQLKESTIVASKVFISPLNSFGVIAVIAKFPLKHLHL